MPRWVPALCLALWLGRTRCDDFDQGITQSYDLDADPTWTRFSVRVGFLGPGPSEITYHPCHWDPHFMSATDAVLGFCAEHGGCDHSSRLDLRRELVRLLRDGAAAARAALRKALEQGPAETIHLDGTRIPGIGGSWFGLSDATTQERHDARAGDLRALLAGSLPPPLGDCAAPSSLQRAVGACPLYDAQEALASLQDSDSQARGDAALQPSGLAAWHAVAHKWFERNEMAHAAAAFLYALNAASDPTHEGHKGLLEGKRLGAAAYFTAEHALGSIASTWGLESAARQLFLGSTAFSEDPALLRDGDSSADVFISARADAWERGCSNSQAAALRAKAALLFPAVAPAEPNLSTSRSRLLAVTQRLAHLPTQAESPSLLLPVAGAVLFPLNDLGSTVFHLAHQGKNDAVLMRSLGTALRRIAPSLVHVAPHLLQSAQTGNDGAAKSSPGAGLKMGVASNYLYDHSIGKMMAELLADMVSERKRLSLS